MHRGRLGGALLVLSLLLAAEPSSQTPVEPGAATFRVFEGRTLVGSASSTLTPEDGGWVLRGVSDLPGLNLAVRQLEVHYDTAWHPRHMTMEMTSPTDEAIVHVAFGLADGTTRTDIVRKEGAIYGANRVAADTIVLPDVVFSAYEALAARLSSLRPGTPLRAFIVPRVEVPIMTDAVAEEALRTRGAPVAASHWQLRFMRAEGPAPVEIWQANGRLIRLELRKEGLTVLRDDLTLDPTQ